MVATVTFILIIVLKIDTFQDTILTIMFIPSLLIGTYTRYRMVTDRFKEKKYRNMFSWLVEMHKKTTKNITLETFIKAPRENNRVIVSVFETESV